MMGYYDTTRYGFDDSYDRERRLKEEMERKLEQERRDAAYELEQVRESQRRLEESAQRARRYRMAEIEQEQENFNQAYNELEELRAENDELREKLRQYESPKTEASDAH
jgi:chromosome segregation ATPase